MMKRYLNKLIITALHQCINTLVNGIISTPRGLFWRDIFKLYYNVYCLNKKWNLSYEEYFFFRKRSIFFDKRILINSRINFV